jgi:hypothetical protein
MRRAVLIVLSLVTLVSPAVALEYSGTCRGASATVTEIDGLDTPRARMVAQTTLPDAIAYCHYSLGSAAGKKPPGGAALQRCAQDFLRDAEKAGPVRATANCKTGTLSTAGANWSNAYKLPLAPMCGDDNNQAISLFKVLCPSYEGKIEEY